MKKAVVLLSGGLDSTTTLAIALHRGFQVYALTFRYGQRHKQEVTAARAVAKHFAVAKHVVLDIDSRVFGASALTTDTLDIPPGSPPGADPKIPITYVPARNTIFLAFALALAEVLGAFDIYLGINAVDYSGYPDCRPAYLEAYQRVANLATRSGVEGKRLTIQAPLLDKTKADIIRLGLALGVDYSLTSTCYNPSPNGNACGRCDACFLRRRGFAAIGMIDPVPYERETK